MISRLAPMTASGQRGAAHLAVIAAGSLWGTFWIPMRMIESLGLAVAWTTLSFCVFSLVLLSPLAILRLGELRAGGWNAILTGLLNGGGFALYAAALVLTDVSRAMLLFYLMPVWTAILGKFLLGDRVTVKRALAIVLGLAGLLIIMRADEQWPAPQNLGDLFALAAGIMWAYGAIRIYAGGNRQSAPSAVFLFFAAGALVCLALLVPLQAAATIPDLALMKRTAPYLVGTALVFVLIPTFMVLWAAARISSTKVGILLMGELLVGLVTAWVLNGEPFGARQVLGAALVIAAAICEIAGKAEKALLPRT